MRKISDAVEQIITEDDLVRVVGSKGLLNNRAYAKSIKERVEELTMKPVKLGSVTTAVSRYLDDSEPITVPPSNDIERISVQKNLAAITYERTEDISSKVSKLYTQITESKNRYITLTQGNNEITVIADHESIERIKNELGSQNMIYDIDSIAGISVKFGIKYMDIPNLFYLLIRRLAVKNINIIEIVSTATELTFIIKNSDVSTALKSLESEF
jgi:aspartokinase